MVFNDIFKTQQLQTSISQNVGAVSGILKYVNASKRGGHIHISLETHKYIEKMIAEHMRHEHIFEFACDITRMHTCMRTAFSLKMYRACAERCLAFGPQSGGVSKIHWGLKTAPGEWGAHVFLDTHGNGALLLVYPVLSGIVRASRIGVDVLTRDGPLATRFD